MKQEAKETLKRAVSKPPVRTSKIKTSARKSSPVKSEPATEKASRSKKSGAKNSTVENIVKKAKPESVKPVTIPPVKKAAEKTKTSVKQKNQPASIAMAGKTKPEKITAKQISRITAKTKPETVSKNSRLKTLKKTAVPEKKAKILSKTQPALVNDKAVKPKVPKKPATVAKKQNIKLETLTTKPLVRTSKKAIVKVPAEKPKTKRTKSAPTVQKIKTSTKSGKSKVSVKTAKMPEKQVEQKPLPVRKPKKKIVKPISSAVVRGKSGRYDFEVFPLDADLKDGQGVYVISRRITDRQGRGHHKFVCIGQTESIIEDLKKHRRDKFIKQNKANVVCLLREEDEKNRFKIETDLRQAHTISCLQK